MGKLEKYLCRFVLQRVHRWLYPVHYCHRILLVTIPFMLINFILELIACRGDTEEGGLILLILVQGVIAWPWIKRIRVWTYFSRLLITSIRREDHHLLGIITYCELVRDLFRLLRLHRLYDWFLKRLDTSSFCNLWLINYLWISRCGDYKLVNHLALFTRFLFFVWLNSYHDFLLSLLTLALEWVYMARGTKFVLLTHLCRQVYPLLLYHVSDYIMATCISKLLYRWLLLSPDVIDMRIIL